MNKSYTYNYVKSFIEKEDYILVSSEYKNVKTPLDILCKNGHLYKVPFERFKNGHRCPFCNKNAKITIDIIKTFCNSIQYELIDTTSLKNSKSKISVKCDKGHLYETSWNYLNSGNKCPICNGGIRHNYEYIKKQIEKEGYTLLSKKYKNAMTKLSIKCDKGHLYKVTYSNFYMNHRCPICNGGIKHNYEYIKKQIEKERYTLISTEYINNNKTLRIKCNKDHQFDMRYSDFQQGQRCPLCSFIDKKSKPEKEIVAFIETIYDGLIIENDRTIVKNPLTNRMLEFDVYLPNINKALEFNGQYWHNNENVKQRDLEKIKQCKEKNINLFIINEKDWKENNNDCLNKIKLFLKS